VLRPQGLGHSFSKVLNCYHRFFTMKYSFRLLCFAFFGLIIFSCTNSKKDQAPKDEEYINPRQSETMQRTNTDTLAVLYNVQKYLNFLKNNQVDSAMTMLYEASGDTVVPASDKTKEQVLQTLKNFPVLDYEILTLNMYDERNTEVRYNVKYFEKTDNDPRQNTIQCVLNPRRVGYYWFLTVPPITYDLSASGANND